MEILKFLNERYVVGETTKEEAAEIMAEVKVKFTQDDAVEFANLVILISELPKECCEEIYSMM